LNVRRLNPAADAGAVARLLAVSFGSGRVDRGQVRALRRTKSSECENRRVVEDGGKVVACLDIVPKRIYIGRAILTMAGLAGVCTDPSARMKGYGRALMDDTVELVRRKKYDLCVLYGIPDFYHRFCFEVVMARHFVTLAQSDIPIVHRPFHRGEIRPRDMNAIRALYAAQARFRDGNCLRRRMSVPGNGFKITDSRGRVTAYALWWRTENSMLVRETVARDANAAADLLQALRHVAWREGLDHLNVQMPFGYPLTDKMASLNSTYHRVNSFHKGCMGQVTNLPSLVSKMTAEWASLLERSEFANRRRAVNVGIGDGVLSLGCAGGRVRASLENVKPDARVTPGQFVQMVFGYRSIRSLAGEPGVRIPAADRRYLEVLFPERNSFLFAPDQF